MIPAMTRPAALSKVMLLEDRRGEAPAGSASVRRYRLARVRAGAAPSQPGKRFDYLKRTFD
jgi:hypothetical protein